MEEKIMILDQIDPDHLYISIKNKEVAICINQILADHAILETLMEELELTVDDILWVMREMMIKDLKISEGIVRLWKKRGRKQITLRECAGTNILLWKMINSYINTYISEPRHSYKRMLLRRRLSVIILKISLTKVKKKKSLD